MTAEGKPGFCRLFYCLLMTISCWSISLNAFPQIPEKNKSMLSPGDDSLVQVSRAGIKTRSFYDSVYYRFNRHKFTRMLYSLAFVAPRVSTLPDTVQSLQSEDQYKQYQGKIIRKITALSLDPFGPTVIDTARPPATGAGRFLNVVHMETNKHVIRKMVLIREGQALDPYVMADQERILKDLNYIDDARVIVIPLSSPDSVDVMIITKDVWSIGAAIPVLTTTKIGLRVFDANFLGFGDRLSLDFSLAENRAPFARFDGFAYTYTNIMGTFTDATITLNQDDQGQLNFGLWFDKPYVTNRTKYAGGLTYQFAKTLYYPTFGSADYASSSLAGIWFGRSYLINSYKIPTRYVASAAVNTLTYIKRPVISIDSNLSFYDVTQCLFSLAFSRNNYYLINYFLDFGKTENMPYGRLMQFTFGPQFTNFYTRMYYGFTYSQGNFISKFGYLGGRLDLGMFHNKNAFEDGVLVARLNYMSYLYFTPDKKYKFRTYITSVFRQGFLRRNNNQSYAMLNQDLHIRSFDSDTVFRGVNSLSSYFSTVIFTPWYFYGFRFAMTGIFAAGFKGDGYSNLFMNKLVTGIGAGLVIKNDNLIFPSILVSAFVYPDTEPGVPWLQLNLSNTPDANFRDYNPSAPSVISILQ
jgi:hypothetical protein